MNLFTRRRRARDERFVARLRAENERLTDVIARRACGDLAKVIRDNPNLRIEIDHEGRSRWRNDRETP